MHLHASLRNAQPGGEMTGFLRLGEQDIFSPLQVTHGKVSLPTAAGLGIEVDKEKLRQLARRSYN
jgi:L-alanine-DL-glutamate epimerase-like enolase superfamily enzyme